MSAAFDTISRRHLLDIVKSIVIDSRINGTSPSKPFTSNVGTP